MSLEGLQKALHSKYLGTLNLYRFTCQEAFVQAYKLAGDSERAQLTDYIARMDQVALNNWVKKILRINNQFEYLDARFLRDLAQQRGIRNYSAMSRLELIGHLKRTGDSACIVKGSPS